MFDGNIQALPGLTIVSHKCQTWNKNKWQGYSLVHPNERNFIAINPIKQYFTQSFNTVTPHMYFFKLLLYTPSC